MAIRNVAVSAAGVAGESLNSQATLIAAVETAIGDAETANAVAGSNADVTTELGLVTAAVAAVTANQPTGAVTVSVDLSAVTTKNQLRRLLDAARVHLEATNLLT